MEEIGIDLGSPFFREKDTNLNDPECGLKSQKETIEGWVAEWHGTVTSPMT